MLTIIDENKRLGEMIKQVVLWKCFTQNLEVSNWEKEIQVDIDRLIDIQIDIYKKLDRHRESTEIDIEN